MLTPQHLTRRVCINARWVTVRVLVCVAQAGRFVHNVVQMISHLGSSFAATSVDFTIGRPAQLCSVLTLLASCAETFHRFGSLLVDCHRRVASSRSNQFPQVGLIHDVMLTQTHLLNLEKHACDIMWSTGFGVHSPPRSHSISATPIPRKSYSPAHTDPPHHPSH